MTRSTTACASQLAALRHGRAAPPHPRPPPSPVAAARLGGGLVEVHETAVDAALEAHVGDDHVVRRERRRVEQLIDVAEHVAVEVEAQDVKAGVEQPRRHVPTQREERRPVEGAVEAPALPARVVRDRRGPAARRRRLAHDGPDFCEVGAVLFALRRDQVVPVVQPVQPSTKLSPHAAAGAVRDEQHDLMSEGPRRRRRPQHVVVGEVAAREGAHRGRRAEGRRQCGRGPLCHHAWSTIRRPSVAADRV